MNTAVAVLSVVVFSLALARLWVVRQCQAALLTAHQTVKALQDLHLTDIDKERLARRAALAMLLHFAKISGILMGALAMAALVVVIAVVTGLAQASAIYDAFLSWPVIILSIVACVLITLRIR